jgi:hypothetical protein
MGFESNWEWMWSALCVGAARDLSFAMGVVETQPWLNPRWQNLRWWVGIGRR